MVYQNKVFNRIDADSEVILSSDYYLHRTIMQAIESPFKSLESNTFSDGLVAIQLSGFLAEKIARANNIINEDQEQELEEYIKKEKQKLIDNQIDVDKETSKARLAYAKIAWILERVEFGKASKTQYKV